MWGVGEMKGKEQYLYVQDIPNLENYLALYHAITSEKEISVGKSLSDMGLIKESTGDKREKGSRFYNSTMFVHDKATNETHKCIGFESMKKVIGDIEIGKVSMYANTSNRYKRRYLIMSEDKFNDSKSS